MGIKDNQLTINIPEGMEIDLQNSNFDTGVIKFKKKELTYKDIKASLKLNENLICISVDDNNSAKLCAINRLMCIAKFYNGDWKPNWSSIEYDINTVYFKREKDAQAVIDNPNFREILDAIYKN